VIGLKDIPNGHTDYFHRVSTPRLPEVWPVSGCGTIYAWPVHRELLRDGEAQTIRVELDPSVTWDIDYVVLALSTRKTVTQLPDWVKQIIYVALGAVLGAVATLLIGG
jgi:hypothetical protein